MVRGIRRRFARAGRDFGFTWRYIFNLAPTLAYQFGRHPVPNEAMRVLAELNRNGVAITSVDKLLGPDSCFSELSAAVDGLERDLREQIAAARPDANDFNLIPSKTFIFSLLGERPMLDPDDVCARFALQKLILQIANSYFGMYTRLRYYNVWHTFTTQVQARQSQLWHRDGGTQADRYILKMFVYLSDVSDDGGPFTYAAGTHPKARLRREPAYILEGNTKRTYDSQMTETVPPERWIRCVGPKGTIIFADTRGYHKGGDCRDRDRIMYICMFTSRADQVGDQFERPRRISRLTDKEQAFALK